MEENKRSKGQILHLGHRQRIKARYSEKGYASLDDTDVVELLLTYAIPRKDVYSTARTLVSEFGSVDGVLKASPCELKEKAKLTDHTVTLLKLVNDIRICPSHITPFGKRRLSNVRSAVEYCHGVLHSFPDEAVIELFLDEESILTDIIRVSLGSVDSVVLPIETIVKNASDQRVKRIIVAHNHPSGSSAPSAADMLATEVLEKALARQGIELAEHIIVSSEECTALIHHQTIKITEGDTFMPWERNEE